MNGTPQPPPLHQPGHPVASLVLGLLGLVAWIIPLIGLPASITGLVFGIKALKGSRKGLAVAGTVLCGIGLVLNALNAAWGAYLGGTGQCPIANMVTGQPSP